jgi:hypothetical protein
MAYAEFFVTTACATTSVTMFGTLGPWIELPDAFHPIMWLNTSSTTTRDLNEGLWIMGATTPLNDPCTATPYVRIYQVQVQNFEPGTRWFLPANIGTKTTPGPTLCRGMNMNGAPLVGGRQWKLYYRAVGEGPDPRRMV